MIDQDVAGCVSSRMMSPTEYLGTSPTALIGRVDDLARLASVLAAPDAGLVTVTGPAGVGKSRLVMEFFRRHWAAAPDGAVEVFDFGRLPDVAGCGRLLGRLKEWCGEDSRAAQATLKRLGEGRRVVLLDHCEDVADELAPLLAEFRRCCPQVRVVSVGTTLLGLYGERVVRLEPLATGGPAATELSAVTRIPAVELFVQCARSVQPEFALTAENSRPVLALCTLLGGLPFAIELAAAQVKLAPPETILEWFESGSPDLRRTGRHPYSRHSGLREIVAWAFAHLRAEERTLLSRLAIFQGPFTLRAATEVVDGLDDGVWRSVERLIDKSVLIPEQRPDGEPILSIPSVLRSAAARSLARLPDYPALRRAHGAYFRAVAEGGASSGPDIEADLLAAFHYWREDGDGQAMAAIMHGLREQCAGAEQARQRLRLAEEVLRVGTGDPRSRARALETAGGLAVRLGATAASGYLTRARDAYRAAHDEAGAVRCLGLLGDAAYASGDLARARSRYEEGLAALAAGGRDGDLARRLFVWRLAVALREDGALARAGELARAALAAELGGEDGSSVVHARYVVATIRWLAHDSAESRALFADAASALDGLPERPECLEIMVIALRKWRLITDWRQVTAVLALADRLRRQLGLDRPNPLAEMIAPILAVASETLSAEVYAGARRAGTEMSWAAAMRLVPGEEPMAEPEPGVPSDVVGILTKRELEVAVLVAEGLTNRLIAHKLGIAEWTVVNHLRKVMRKLGCQSRVHVTRRLGVR